MGVVGIWQRIFEFRPIRPRRDPPATPVEVEDELYVEGRGTVLVVNAVNRSFREGQQVSANGKTWRVRAVEKATGTARVVGLVVMPA